MYKFQEPILVTRPLMPNKNNLSLKIGEIIDSQWLTNNGPYHNKLEEKLMQYLNVDNITLFSNGTMALLLGLKSLELTGEVITTPFTFPATLEALDWNGLTPIFCDIDPSTYCINVEKIEELITEKTSAILAVHVFGNPCDVEKIEKIAQKYNLKVVYDGAHVFHTRINGRPISEYGDMTMLSFHATKLFNTVEGGALICRDKTLKNKLNLLKNFGIAGEGQVLLSGLNAKMNELQAVFGLEVLENVDAERIRRHQVKKIYDEYFDKIEGIRPVTVLNGDENSYQYYVIEINEEEYGVSRNELYERLKEFNVFTRKYFDPLCSNLSWYDNNNSAKKKELIVANDIINKVLSIPFYGGLNEADVKNICDIISSLGRSDNK